MILVTHYLIKGTLLKHKPYPLFPREELVLLHCYWNPKKILYILEIQERVFDKLVKPMKFISLLLY